MGFLNREKKNYQQIIAEAQEKRLQEEEKPKKEKKEKKNYSQIIADVGEEHMKKLDRQKQEELAKARKEADEAFGEEEQSKEEPEKET